MVDNYNFEQFDETTHMLDWFHPSPIEAIKSQFRESLDEQVKGSVLLGLHVIDKPQWLTGAIPQENDESKAVLVRLALAFIFKLSVSTPEGETHDLEGVYTWASVNMNDPQQKKQRTWMDLNGTLEEFGSNGALSERLYFGTEE